MYWIITLSVSIGGLLLLWTILTAKWSRVTCAHDSIDHRFQLSLIHTTRTLQPWLPGDPGYLDLKFSVLRHAFVFGVSAVILRFVGYGFWESAITFVNLLYVWLPISRYRYRKKMTEALAAENRRAHRDNPEEAEGFREILKLHNALIRDSFVVIPYAIVCWLSLYLLMLYK